MAFETVAPPAELLADDSQPGRRSRKLSLPGVCVTRGTKEPPVKCNRFARAFIGFVTLLGSTAAAGNVTFASPSASAQVTVAAAGFDSPRGVAVTRGKILVAESGHGGDVC